MVFDMTTAGAKTSAETTEHVELAGSSESVASEALLKTTTQNASSFATVPPSDFYQRIILVHWVLLRSVNLAPGEALELSWVVYDIETSSILESSKHLLRPTETALTEVPAAFLKTLKLKDTAPLEHAATLQQVLQQFEVACVSTMTPCVCCVLNSGRLRQELLSETFRKSITTPKHLKSVLDLSFLVTHFYPEQFTEFNNESSSLTSLEPEDIAKRLQTPYSDEMVSDSSALSVCVGMSLILKKMYLDEVRFQSQHATCVIAAPSTSAMKLASASSTSRPSSFGQDSKALQHVVRLRGVPWGATEEDIVKFFEPVCSIVAADVYIATYLNGRASGEVYVSLPTMADRDKSLQELHGRHMGKRWIEVFKASENDLQRLALVKDTELLENRGALRLRGLPWSTNEYDVVKFFTDSGFSLNINHVILGLSHNNRFNGDAWVILDSPQVADEAKRVLHKKSMGKRYIEVFSATLREVEMVRRGCLPYSASVHPPSRSYVERCSPYTPISSQMQGMSLSNPRLSAPVTSPYQASQSASAPLAAPVFSYAQSGMRLPQTVDESTPTTNVLRLRGLPYHANETHILEFFQGYGLVQILLMTAPVEGRPSGEAYVEFVSSEEAWRALKQRHGALIDQRYIELFPSTKQEMQLAASGVNLKAPRF